MSDQHEHQSDDEQGADTEGHRYVPRDERAGAARDTEGHRVAAPGDPVNEPSTVRGRDRQGRR